MNGRPVWLASVALRDHRGDIIPTPELGDDQRKRAEQLLRWALHGVGDESREVFFRMNLSMCLHRGLTDDEERRLPSSFHDFVATDSAGAAVEVLSARGVSGIAHLPCENPARKYLQNRPHYWLPEPCGQCGPCRAREATACRVG
jgi:hypothetical protein